jgi:hypothetical protein
MRTISLILVQCLLLVCATAAGSVEIGEQDVSSFYPWSGS